MASQIHRRFGGVPTYESNTRVCVRSSRGFVTGTLIGPTVTKIQHWADRADLWQNKTARLSMQPTNPDEAKGEVRMDFKPPIVERHNRPESYALIDNYDET